MTLAEKARQLEEEGDVKKKRRGALGFFY